VPSTKQGNTYQKHHTGGTYVRIIYPVDFSHSSTKTAI
jgi:hypothetical protein